MQPGPTLYGELKTPVTEDLLEVGLIVAFAIIAGSFILIIPGIRGAEVRKCDKHTQIITASSNLHGI